MVGYNVQSAVDTKHHLIVTHEVTNVGSDRSQLSRMTEQARAAIGSEAIEAVADRGYYSGEEIVACEQAGITVYLPKPMTSGLLAKGRFGKQDFVYVVADDGYLCPAGEQLTYHYTNEEEGKTLRRYWTTACQACVLKSKCTTGKERFDRNPAKMRERRQTVEHPFGTIKSWMGATHFQMKTLKNVGTEMALHVLAYKKGNQHPGRWWFDGGDPGIGSASQEAGRACSLKHPFLHSLDPQQTFGRHWLICVKSGSRRNRPGGVSLSSMEYRDTEYQILQTANQTGWKWTVLFDGQHIRTGSAYNRAGAIALAQRAIDGLLKPGMKEIVVPSPSTESQ